MVELSLIKLLLKHDNYLGSQLEVADFPKELQSVYLVLNKHHVNNATDLTIPDLSNLYFSAYSKDKDYYQELFNNLEKLDVSEESSKTLLDSLVTKRRLKELSLKAYEAYEGKEKLDTVLDLINNFNKIEVVEDNNTEFEDDDIELIYTRAFLEPGLRWRLTTMNKMLGSLRNGDFGFIFARPETGKTTFLASEETFMAEQVAQKDLGPILHVANEEEIGKIIMRFYQAAFGIDLPTLQSDLPGWKKKWRDKFNDKFKFISRADLMSRTAIQKMCDKYKPSLLVVDQLSKVGGFDNDRKDLELGAACEWGRYMAKTYAPTIAIHQADGTGEGVQWLTMNHVANAKTAMQAEADWILGIGCQHKAGYETIRYLHLSKNKLTGDPDTDPNLRHGKKEVLIEPLIGRYKDLMYE